MVVSDTHGHSPLEIFTPFTPRTLIVTHPSRIPTLWNSVPELRSAKELKVRT